MTAPIIKSLEVPCDAAAAFDVFVTRIGSWWPLDSHAASAADGKAAKNVTIDARVGGQIVETKHDGTPDLWGVVSDLIPGEKIAFSWHPGGNKDTPTHVEIVFEDAADDRARVTLTHSGWQVWANHAEEKRAPYDSGWDMVFGQRYTAACDAVSA